MGYLRIIQVEWIKLKRSGIMFVIFGAPLLVLTMQFLNFKLRYNILVPSGSSPWWGFIQEVGSFWGALVLPVIAAIFAAIICGVEHSSNAWKYIITMPIRRMYFYTGKLLLTFSLLIAASIILTCGLVISGIILGFNEPIPWEKVGWLFIYPLLGVAALTSIQIWLSTRIHNHSIPIGIGVISVVASLFLSQSSSTHWYPWVYPLMTAPIGNPYEPGFYSFVSICVGLICTFIGLWEFSRRDI